MIAIEDRARTESRDFGSVRLVHGDAIAGMATLDPNSVDLAIVDPPYGVTANAVWSLPRDHRAERFGGAWKIASHDWDRLVGSSLFEFTVTWLSELKRLVKPSGSIWIHGTYHNIGFVNVACQLIGLEIINEVVWFKRNAFPNLSGRRLTASHETILWAHTGGEDRQYRFNYEATKAAQFPGDALKLPGKQMRTVWDIPNNKSREELRFGTHPTQKPLRVTERLLAVAGVPGGLVLAPFAGSGTELLAAMNAGMRALGYETDRDYFELASRRLSHAAESSKDGLWRE